MRYEEQRYGRQRPDDGLWTNPDMRNALAARDMRAVCKHLVESRGLSQAELAAMVGMDQSEISRVITGRRTIREIEIFERFRDGLGIPGRLLGLLPGHAETQSPVSVGYAQGFEEDKTDRREFLQAAALTGVAATATGAERPQSLTREHDGRPESIRVITAGMRKLDASVASQELTPALTSHLRMATQLLNETRSRRFKQELAAATGEAAGFAAWLHFDTNDLGAARSYYKAAVGHAQQTHDPLMTAYMLGSYGSFAVHLGDAEAGLSLIEEAWQGLGRGAPATARTWLRSMEALAHANRRDSEATREAIRQAERALASSNREGTPPWPWVFAFDEAKLAGQRAVCAVRLNEPDAAQAAFDEALLSSVSPKQYALLLVERATAYGQQREIDESFRLAEESLRIGSNMCSEKLLQRVRAFRREFDNFRATRAAQHFDNQLSEVYRVRQQ